MKAKVLKASGMSSHLSPLFRPQRKSYVKKEIKYKNCIFCEAAKKKPQFKTLCVYKSQHTLILLNKFPYNSGHLLVLPQNHEGDLTLLTQECYQELTQVLRMATSVVKKIYNPKGMNLGLNQGEAAGAGIPDHLHFHLIPRWSGDLNFFPLIGSSKVLIETLEETYEKMTLAILSSPLMKVKGAQCKVK